MKDQKAPMTQKDILNNSELNDLGTHQAGKTDLHKTRTLSQPQVINAPEWAPSGIDSRQEENPK